MDDGENMRTHNLIHTYLHTLMYACTKLVYIFMFVDIFRYILWWKTVSVSRRRVLFQIFKCPLWKTTIRFSEVSRRM